MQYPKLVDAFILARMKGDLDTDWVISSENKDYINDKPYYICRWLNHSFMPFTKKQQKLYEEWRIFYNKIKNNSE